MRTIVASVVLLALAGCGPGTADLTNVAGTVVFVPLEGGFYGVVADNGTQYEPRNLPASLAKDGQRIVFDAKFINGSSTSQWGRAIRLVAVVGRPPPGTPVSGEGTVVFLDIEGGFFALFGDDGQRYEPRGLGAPLSVDGQRVVFAGHARDDIASALLWGTVLDLSSAAAGPPEAENRVVRRLGTRTEDGILGDDGVSYLATNEPGSMPGAGTRVGFVAVRRPELPGAGGNPVVTVLDLRLP